MADQVVITGTIGAGEWIQWDANAMVAVQYVQQYEENGQVAPTATGPMHNNIFIQAPPPVAYADSIRTAPLDTTIGRDLLRSVLTAAEWAEYEKESRFIVVTRSGHRYLVDGNSQTCHGPYGYGTAARNVFLLDVGYLGSGVERLGHQGPAKVLCVMASSVNGYQLPLTDQLAAQVLFLRMNEPEFRRTACG